MVLALVVAMPRAAVAGPTCDPAPCAGNAWHIPSAAQPGIDSMRLPVRAVAGAPVTIYSGNQYAGAGGNPGNQMQAGSRVVYRVGGGAWTDAPMTFVAQSGNDKFFAATLPAAPAGTEIAYYLRIAYSDHPVTFVYGADERSATTVDEAVARAAPFQLAVPWPLAPDAGADAVAVDAGGVAAQLYPDSGHVAMAGVTLAPPLIQVDGAWRLLGPAMSVSARGDEVLTTHSVAGAAVHARLWSPDTGILRFEITDWAGLAPEAIELAAASAADERFYGLGEKFDRLDQSGKVAHMLARDAPGAKGDLSYKVVPWFLSTRGYGFHLDSAAPSSFDLRGTATDRWVIRQPAGGLAYHLISGAGPAEILSRFTAIAGRPPLPPPWAFAPWLSTDHWRDGGEIRYAVTRYRALGLPGSVIVFDSPWERSYNDLTWNQEQFAAGGTYEGTYYSGFATPADMLAFLDANGFRALVWMTPFLNVSSNDEGVPGQVTGKSSLYDEAAAAGYLVRAAPGGPPLLVDWWKGRGSPVDFTNPAARAWFQGKLAALVADSGGVIAGFKTDDGESDFIPADAAYFDGRRGREMVNAYSVAYHGAVYQVLGDAGLLWSRSGFTGTQAFPGHWAGDNEPNFGAENGLPSVIVAGLSAAMSGWSIWGHDIGGYQEGNPSSTPENLFMRWTQFGALTPIMQMHRQVGGGHQYPWSYGDAATDNYRRWAELHTQLFPYLYACAAEAARSGLPIMRPPVLLHPDDPSTYGLNHTYYLGDWLLAAPVITNVATTRTVYLPEGTWYDLATGEEHAGGAELTWQSGDQSRMPLFVRQGAIVPMLPAGTLSLIDVPDALEVHIWPAAASSFTLHDGGTVACRTEPEQIVVDVDTRARPLVLRVRSTEPLAVTRDGADVPWSWADGVTTVDLAHAGGASAIALRFTAAPPDPEPDAGGGGAGPPGGGGCGCVGGGGGSPGALLLAIVAIMRAWRPRSSSRATASAGWPRG